MLVIQNGGGEDKWKRENESGGCRGRTVGKVEGEME